MSVSACVSPRQVCQKSPEASLSGDASAREMERRRASVYGKEWLHCSVFQVGLAGETQPPFVHRDGNRVFCQGEGKDQGKYSLTTRPRIPYKGGGGSDSGRIRVKSKGAGNKRQRKHHQRSKANSLQVSLHLCSSASSVLSQITHLL